MPDATAKYGAMLDTVDHDELSRRVLDLSRELKEARALLRAKKIRIRQQARDNLVIRKPEGTD